MSLSVTTAAATHRLTRLENVTAELGQPSTDNAVVTSLIDEASAAVCAYTNRGFAREVYSESLAGSGGIYLLLKRFPLISLSTVTINTSVVTDAAIEDPDAGTLYRRLGWSISTQRYVGIGYRGKFLDYGIPLPGQDEPLTTVAYTAGYILPEQNLLSKVTLSVASADNSFNDTAAGFPALLKAGDQLRTSSFTNAANNGYFTVTGTPTTSKITVSQSLTTEAAAASASMLFLPPANVKPFETVEKATIEAVKAWYAARKDDANVIEKHVGPMGLRYSERAGRSFLPATCVGLLASWMRRAA